MNNQAPPMLKPALISGVAFGVAGAIPVINWINCACCALIIGCGFLAAFLYSKDCKGVGAAFRPGNGATIGLLSGLIYGVVSGVLSGIISAAFGMNDWQEVIDQIRASGAEIDPAVLDQISGFMESSGSLMMILIGLFFALLFGAIFGTIGGLIGGSVFRNEPQAAVTGQAPPPPVG
jgi:hypothetical protein